MEHDQQSPAVACSLDASDFGRRVSRWQALAAQADPRLSRTDRGLRVSFAGEPGVGDELAELAALERDCCAFATWSVSEDSGRLVLDVSAVDDEGVLSVQAMFAELGSLGQ